jgi:hypothetical protein
MDASGEASGTRFDERGIRFERAATALLLIAGFVWGQDLVIVALAIVVAAPLLPGGPRVLGVPWEHLIAPRLGPPKRTLRAVDVRAGDMLLGALLGVASAAVLLGIGFAGRWLGLAVAVLAAMEATGAVHVSTAAARWLRRRSG